MTALTAVPPSTAERTRELLTLFRVPSLARELVVRFEQAGQAEALGVMLELLELEAAERHQRKVERLALQSKLPIAKTFDTFDASRIPRTLAQTVKRLSSGEFIDDAMNVLAFGMPGTGKTHAACAIGHALVQLGRSVLFVPTFQLVQHLLAAKRDLNLPSALRKLDNFDLLILDDIGYVKQSAEEIEVLFTLMAERYERRSMLITSNLAFSDWNQIFHNPMTTAAAIDRLVHHCVILEFNNKSFRCEQAEKQGAKPTRTNKETE